MREISVGQGAALRMASFYVLLAEADPKGEQASKEAQLQKTSTRNQVGTKTPARVRVKEQRIERETSNGQQGKHVEQVQLGPTIHIDVQVHIPSGADPDQIDAIFASMAKHLYRR
jgi:hypothetical protein